MIEVSEQTINRIHAILAGVENADKKVLKPALTRGLMAGKTAAGKAVRQTYHISAGDTLNLISGITPPEYSILPTIPSPPWLTLLYFIYPRLLKSPADMW